MSHTVPRHTVRFSTVMFGGTSLAIYMSGVAQELLHLTRATQKTFGECSDLEKQYFHIANLYGHFRQHENKDLPVQMLKCTDSQYASAEFIVDILSGTSAGGLNASFLARALVMGGDLEVLTTVWAKQGGAAELLQAPKAAKCSFFDGDKFFQEIYKALDQIKGEYPVNYRVDLFNTVTDLQGINRKLPLINRNELVHTHLFHFRYSPSAASDPFANTTMLAYASRVSAGIPPAFSTLSLKEAYALNGSSELLNGNLFPKELKDKFAIRRYSDGGILDNKPFGAAIKAMKNSYGVGRRVLIYLEPIGEASIAQSPENNPTHPFFDLLKSGLDIRQKENIRTDLEQLERINILAQHLQKTEAYILGKVELTRIKDFEKSSLDDMVKVYGMGYPMYHKLKLDLVLNWLAQRMAHVFDDSQTLKQIQNQLQDWYTRHYSDNGEDNKLFANTFLNDFDVLFRIRRLVSLRDVVRREYLKNATEEHKQLYNDLERYIQIWDNVDERIQNDPKCREAIQAFLQTEKPTADALNTLKVLIEKTRQDVSESLKKTLKLDKNNLNNPTSFLKHYLSSNHIDMVLLPAAATLGDERLIPIDVWRIGTEEASTRKFEPPKLAGVQLAFFGAFFRTEWRLNDILWGRLDASEILVKRLFSYETLTEPQQHQLDKVIENLQNAIWIDFWNSISRDKDMKTKFTELYTSAGDNTNLDTVLASRLDEMSLDARKDMKTLVKALRFLPTFFNFTKTGLKIADGLATTWVNFQNGMRTWFAVNIILTVFVFCLNLGQIAQYLAIMLWAVWFFICGTLLVWRFLPTLVGFYFGIVLPFSKWIKALLAREVKKSIPSDLS